MRDDVVAVIEAANRHGVPVLPRGGGTSLAGQTVGHAIVVDFSKYMRHVLEIDAEEGWVRTQPGIVLDELNHHLEPHGLLFAPDPSTSNRGNVGGALGNNSCGAHSIVWGKTVDNVERLDVVLSNGQTAEFGALTGAELESKMRLDGLEGDIYRRLFAIGEANREEIVKRYPSIQRRVAGYNLDEFVGGNRFDMARFVVGSEGTLVAVTEAKLKVVPRPRMKALAIIHFREAAGGDGGDRCDPGDEARRGRADRKHDSQAGASQLAVLPHDGLHRGRPRGCAGGGDHRRYGGRAERGASSGLRGV